MPRQPRAKSASNIYHVVIRGADRQIIFEEERDYKKYIELLRLYSLELHFDIYAYCLMSNHIHLLIHTPECSTESIFRHLSTHYAVWFNMKYSRTGHVQQGRYHSEPIEDEEYFLTVMRYIHQNPTKAGLESQAGESYPWTSIFEYLSGNSFLVHTDHALSILGGISNFSSFHSHESVDTPLDIHHTKRRIPDDVAKEIIFEQTHCSNTTEFQNLPLVDRNTYLKLLHKEKGISIRQLNRLTGIPKGVIDRIMTKGHSSWQKKRPH